MPLWQSMQVLSRSAARLIHEMTRRLVLRFDEGFVGVASVAKLDGTGGVQNQLVETKMPKILLYALFLAARPG